MICYTLIHIIKPNIIFVYFILFYSVLFCSILFFSIILPYMKYYILFSRWPTAAHGSPRRELSKM